VILHDSVLGLIGGTPLVRLRGVTAGLAATVAAKLEFLNPGGSIKDRIAVRMVEAAERSGGLRPGGVVVECTSGNTGVGLAMVAALRGYRCVFTCPDKVSADKRAVLRAYGAEVVVCPAAVPPEHPDSYRSTAARIAAETPGAVLLDQYRNPENPGSHYAGLGPEIWRQTDGAITHFVTGVGTGGTVSGAGRYLKQVSGGRVRVVGADPDGSVYSGGTGRPYLLEGVGQPSLPPSYDAAVPDEVVAVTDRDAMVMTRRLAREEALLAGGSSGMAVVAALRIAARLPAGALVVVPLPDSGRGYLGKTFDDGWLARYGLLDPPGVPLRARDVSRGATLQVPPGEPVGQVAKLLASGAARHVLVAAAEPPLRPAEVLGSAGEATLAGVLAAGRAWHEPVSAVMDPPPGALGAGEPVTEVLAAGAALILDGGLVAGVLTAADVLRHLAAAGEPATSDGRP